MKPSESTMNKDRTNIILFLSPLVIFILLFVLVPILGSFWVSLTRDVSILPGTRFIGAGNYISVLRDSQFFASALFTILFAVVSVSLEMILGMIVALVINEKFPGRNLMRGVALLPWAIPCVIGARVWQLIYRYDFGLANLVLSSTLGISVNWMGGATGAFFSLVVADVWRTTAFVAILVLAGLQTVPEELYEQGRIDGAGIWGRFIHITLPSIKAVMIVALVFRTIDALRVFDIIYVITGGGPGGATSSLSLYSYQFFLMGDFGMGCAVSILLFGIAFIFSLSYLKLGRFREAAL